MTRLHSNRIPIILGALSLTVSVSTDIPDVRAGFNEDGNDTLKGGCDNDTLKGNKGKDTLQGQKGKDVGNGGAFKDECRSIEVAKNCEL